MIIEPPPGYPPPVLVRKRSAKRPLALLILVAFVVAAIIIGLLERQGTTEQTAPARAQPAPPATKFVGNADSAAESLPDAGDAAVAVETALAEPVRAANAPDGRKANLWYFVPRLADGPGAIYSRDGHQWSFALSCTTRRRTIEFIAIGTGSPGYFDKQSIKVGKVRLMMDATYSKEQGGTISTTLPAAHPFFKALDGSAPMEVQLVAGRKIILPVGPAVTHLVDICRGRA